jgi:hypothetical protein
MEHGTVYQNDSIFMNISRLSSTSSVIKYLETQNSIVLLQ